MIFSPFGRVLDIFVFLRPRHHFKVVYGNKQILTDAQKNKMRNGKLTSITLSHAHWRRLKNIWVTRDVPHVHHICAPYDMIYRQSCDNLHLVVGPHSCGLLRRICRARLADYRASCAAKTMCAAVSASTEKRFIINGYF